MASLLSRRIRCAGAVGQSDGRRDGLSTHQTPMVSLFIFSAPLLAIRALPGYPFRPKEKTRAIKLFSSTRQTVSVLPIRPSPLTRGAAALAVGDFGMSEDQRREAMVALGEGERGAARLQRSAKKGGKRAPGGRARNDRRRARGGSGVSPLRWPRNRRLGPLAWAFAVSLQELRAHLQYADQDADGASAQEGFRWLDHARAMIEGKSLAKTAALCGIHPTTAFRWRHRFLRAPASDKPRGFRGIVEADETFVLEFFKGRRSDLPRKARRRGGTARHPGLHQDNIPILVARDRNGATFDAILAQVVDGASVSLLSPESSRRHPLIGDGGKAIATFARRAGIAFHTVPSPGKPSPAAPHLHINNVNAYHRRLKQWLNRFQRRRHSTCPIISVGGALEAWGDKLTPSWTQRRYRKRAISDNAIRALKLGLIALVVDLVRVVRIGRESIR